jgi:hypothetical protein
MAHLDVQPKKNTSWLLWLILGIIALALLLFLTRACNSDDNVAATGDTTAAVTADNTTEDDG